MDLDLKVVAVAALAGAASAVAVTSLLGSQLSKKKKKPMRLICTDKAAPASGHYSQAVVKGHEVFISGLLPITPSGEKLNGASFTDQTIQVLDNLKAILADAGSSPDKLVSVRVYISNLDNWVEFNSLYSKMVGAHRPARAVVPVPALHYGFSLELEAIAVL